MKKILTLFFQAVIMLIGICAFVFMLWEPLLEGRNAHATLYEIYFNDPFLACAYLASIAFFVWLYQLFKLLGYVREGKFISQKTIKALNTITYCSFVIIGFIIARRVYIQMVIRGTDDIAGGVVISSFLALISITVVISCLYIQKNVRKKL